MLTQPIFTFKQVEAGAEAARQRTLVETARLRETENMIALEVRRLYTMRLFALSMLSPLEHASKIVEQARQHAQKLYQQGTGKTTQADLMRLRYAANELKRFQVEAHNSMALLSSALKHTMGLPHGYPVQFGDERLPLPPAQDWLDVAAIDPENDINEQGLQHTPPALRTLFIKAAENRPEWAQIDHGKRAAHSWGRAEKLSNWPIVAIAGVLQAAWTPTRSNATNPYWRDPFNELFGGVALGLQWNFDPARASADVAEAHATYRQVEALEHFASTGIPLQIRQAYFTKEQAKRALALNRDSVKATHKWITFATAAYTTGTGKARDVLEGVIFYVQSRHAFYDSLRDYHIAQAELDYAVGREY